MAPVWVSSERIRSDQSLLSENEFTLKPRNVQTIHFDAANHKMPALGDFSCFDEILQFKVAEDLHERQIRNQRKDFAHTDYCVRDDLRPQVTLTPDSCFRFFSERCLERIVGFG